eukprot:GHRR01015258.1.p1 GENE.GHRR01015258.1~~GHRR01015258.1.p1  ORF type:complete len:170 (+),score=33.57 GHRR01015258.1:325-834(+)
MPPCWGTMDECYALIAAKTQERRTIVAAQGLHASSLGTSSAADQYETTTSSYAAKRLPLKSGHKLGRSVFIKHRHGVKGRQTMWIIPFSSFIRGSKRNVNDFVVQEEVQSMLLDGRKFVLRLHVMLTHMPTCVFLHQHVVHQHASLYVAGSDGSAVHISRKGRGRPVPV